MLGELLSGNFSFSFESLIIYILSSLAVIFITLPVHEFAHGFAATKLGDPTPRYQGRLTLNPFAHIDYLGSLCILLFGFGWAKPVQVNARNFKNQKGGMAITAFAGPLSNLIFALICLFFVNGIFKLYFSTNILFLEYLYYFFFYIAQINISLAVFNLIPVPPLDGSRILFAFLPSKFYFGFMRYERYIIIGLLVLIYTGVFDMPLAYLTNVIYNMLQTIAGLPFGI